MRRASFVPAARVLLCKVSENASLVGDGTAGGEDYLTRPDFYMQSEALAKIVTTYPDYFAEESGGLLRAMIIHSDTWEDVASSEMLAKELLNREPLLPRWEMQHEHD
jgi:hypothetical protein